MIIKYDEFMYRNSCLFLLRAQCDALLLTGLPKTKGNHLHFGMTNDFTHLASNMTIGFSF